MARATRKNRSIRMLNREWAEVEAAARVESERRGDHIEPGTLARELTLKGARRINVRAALLSAAARNTVESLAGVA